MFFDFHCLNPVLTHLAEARTVGGWAEYQLVSLLYPNRTMYGRLARPQRQYDWKVHPSPRTNGLGDGCTGNKNPLINRPAHHQRIPKGFAMVLTTALPPLTTPMAVR